MPTLPANTHRWLHTGDEAFEAMLDAIGAACHAIRLEVYLCTDCPLTRRFLAALLEARGRGVQVRVLVDDFGSLDLPASFWGPLAEAGGHVRRFNPVALDRLAYRNHRKLLVCDDRVAILGGFNLAPEYEGDGIARGFRDIGLRMTGAIVPRLAESFDLMFERAEARLPLWHRLRPGQVATIVNGDGWRLLLNFPSLLQRGINRMLLADLRSPDSVDIVAAYFLPTRRIRRNLIRLARSGVRVRLLLAGRSDVPIAQFAGRRLYEQFLRAGVEIYEYEPQVLHAKMVLIGNIAYAGSCNLDLRSLRLNYELMVRLDDPALSAEARERFEADRARAIRVDAAGWRHRRGLWTKLREELCYFLLARIDPWVIHWQLRILR